MFALVHGDFKERPPMELLKVCEEKRFTGVVEVSGKGLGGNLQLRAGDIEEVAITGATGDPLEAFLSLAEGRFTLRQQMPNLEGKLSAESVVRGSLTQHAPADVMRYCESAGLSGQVRLTNGPRHVEVFYDAGQITAITVDGKTDADLEDAWGWSTGDFRVTARSLFEEPPRSPEESGLHFLRVMQVALSQVIEKAERKREKTDTQQRPIPLVTRKKKAPEARKDQSVQVYFMEEPGSERPTVPSPGASTASDAPPPRPSDQGARASESPGFSAPGFSETLPAIDPPSRRTTPPQPLPVHRPRPPAPLWVWMVLGAAIGGIVVAMLAHWIR